MNKSLIIIGIIVVTVLGYIYLFTKSFLNHLSKESILGDDDYTDCFTTEELNQI